MERLLWMARGTEEGTGSPISLGMAVNKLLSNKEDYRGERHRSQIYEAVENNP